MKASEYIKRDIVNVINEKWNPDGTVEVVIYREGWKRAYKFKSIKFGDVDEKIIEDEEVEEG